MGKLKILAVDDDPVTLLLIEKKLNRQGYVIETAKSGKEAVEYISEQPYDVILTDLMMPGSIDGIGVLDAVKRRYENTHVILLTAHASVDTAVEAMKKGAADYLQKPINFDELMIRLERINSLKVLEKNAGDLREAMDITEKNAGQTIQDLEMTVSGLKNKLLRIRDILSEENKSSDERIKDTLGMLVDFK